MLLFVKLWHLNGASHGLADLLFLSSLKTELSDADSFNLGSRTGDFKAEALSLIDDSCDLDGQDAKVKLVFAESLAEDKVVRPGEVSIIEHRVALLEGCTSRDNIWALARFIQFLTNELCGQEFV